MARFRQRSDRRVPRGNCRRDEAGAGAGVGPHQVFGLTGRIASGKSTVLQFLHEKGARTIDADRIARLVVEPRMPAYEEIVERFGSGVCSPDGSLDRAKLASLVFADDAARRDLERITHPRIRDEIAILLGDDEQSEITVIEVAMLFEAERWLEHLELAGVIVVASREPVRMQRLIDLRRMSVARAKARIESQGSELKLRRRADYLIENNGSLADLKTAVDSVWTQLQAEAS